MAAVRRIVPGVDVEGCVLFPDGAEFSKGQPDQVRLSAELVDQIRDDRDSQDRPGDDLRSAWNNLVESIRPA